MNPREKLEDKLWLIGLAFLIVLAATDSRAEGYTLAATYKKLTPLHPHIVPVRLAPLAGVRHWPAQTYRSVDGR